MPISRNIRVKSRVDTLENWEHYNPILEDREVAYIKETGQYKIGDGKKDWKHLTNIYGNLNGDGDSKHAIKDNLLTFAYGDYSHAGGKNCQANGNYSFAFGYETAANADISFSAGYHTVADVFYQTAIGKYNDAAPKGLLIVGNGSSEGNRTNAFVVNENGSIEMGDCTFTKENLQTLYDLANKLVDVSEEGA